MTDPTSTSPPESEPEVGSAPAPASQPESEPEVGSESETGTAPESDSESALEIQPERAPRSMARPVILLAGLVLGVLLGGGALLVLGGLRGSVAIAADGSTIGTTAAPVTIEVWADYQCPYCALMAHGIEPAIIRDQVLTGRARVTFRDFAILGQESIDAAGAAHCALAQGKFWDYHDLLYTTQQGENQGTFSRSNLIGLARFIHLDEAAFTTCLDEPATAAAVTEATAAGKGLGVESTPTYRISGAGGTILLTGVKDARTIADAVRRATTPGASETPTPSSAAPSGSAGSSAAPSGSAEASAAPSAAPPGSSSP